MTEESIHLIEESNLETYLSDVYTHDIAQDIEQCDVDFIQSGVEFVADNLTVEILKRLKPEINHELETFQRHFPDLKRIDEDLAESIDIKEHVVKTGAFYEEGILGSPDDFHFFLIIGEFQSDSDVYSCHGYPTLGQKAIRKSMRNVIHQITIRQYDAQNEIKKKFFKKYFQHSDGDEKQHIVLNKVDMTQRATCKVSMLYSDRRKHEKHRKLINVIFTTAIRVHLIDTADCICPESFLSGTVNRSTPKELINPRKLCVLGGNISMVENEHYFTKSVLSSNHRKVFSLTKHMLKLNERIKPEALTDDRMRKSHTYHVTLYELKRCITYHHYFCGQKSSSTGSSTCVLDILSDIYDGDYLQEVQSLSMRKAKLKRLRKLLEILQTTEKSSQEYIYEDISKLIKSMEMSRSVVKTLQHVREDHNDCLQYCQCFICIVKYLAVIGIGAIILYFMFHVIVTPR